MSSKTIKETKKCFYISGHQLLKAIIFFNVHIYIGDLWYFVFPVHQGQPHQFRALGLGQRPFMENASFSNHLRELDTYRRVKTEESPVLQEQQSYRSTNNQGIYRHCIIFINSNFILGKKKYRKCRYIIYTRVYYTHNNIVNPMTTALYRADRSSEVHRRI